MSFFYQGKRIVVELSVDLVWRLYFIFSWILKIVSDLEFLWSGYVHHVTHVTLWFKVHIGVAVSMRVIQIMILLILSISIIFFTPFFYFTNLRIRILAFWAHPTKNLQDLRNLYSLCITNKLFKIELWRFSRVAQCKDYQRKCSK